MHARFYTLLIQYINQESGILKQCTLNSGYSTKGDAISAVRGSSADLQLYYDSEFQTEGALMPKAFTLHNARQDCKPVDSAGAVCFENSN